MLVRIDALQQVTTFASSSGMPQLDVCRYALSKPYEFVVKECG